MLFNSLHYMVFLPLVVAVYFALPQQGRRYWILAASFYFYAVFSLPLTLLLVYSTVLDYGAAIFIDRTNKEWQRRVALITSIAGNLAVLFFFKYAGFFSGIVNNIAGQEIIPFLEIILPIGISFYTFQTMSYTIDVYRRQIRAEHNILDVALYVAYFPQLLAGPIMRAADLMPQFREKRTFDSTLFLSGFLLIVWGLTKKIFIADPMSDIVDSIYTNPQNQSGAALLLGTYGFAVQIFCDFSAYTDIAIGSARLMGFRLIENFRTPYLATSITDFWGRWHISLSTWFRDYVYIPLGGNKKGLPRTYINLGAAMLLCGLWHGASWNFVIWGGLHGLYLIVERILGKHKKLKNAKTSNKLLRWFVTFHLVCLGWIFFRAETLNDATLIVQNILVWQNGEPALMIPLYVLTGILTMQLLQNRFDIQGFFMRHALFARWLAYGALAFCMLALMGGQSPEFIYFQF